MRIALCFFLFLNVYIVVSQTSFTNQEFLNVQERIRLLSKSNLDSAFVYSDFLEKSVNFSHKAFANGAKCYLYQLRKDSVKSKESFKIAIDFLSKTNDKSEKENVYAAIYNFGGLANWKNGNLNEALKKFDLGLKYAKINNNIKLIIKLSNNISIINSEVGNYRTAIKIVKKTSELLSANEHLLSINEYINSKSLNNLNIGIYYERLSNFENNKLLKNKYIDSAIYFLKKSTYYSKKNLSDKVSANMSLAKLYFIKKEYNKAFVINSNLYNITKENNLTKEFQSINCNLGIMFFDQKKIDLSLYHFKKVDSIYNKFKIIEDVYTISNHYQSKIYNFKNETEKAITHSEIYIKNSEKVDLKKNREIARTQKSIKETNDLDEIIKIKNNNIRYQVYKILFYVFLFLAFVYLIYKYIKIRRQKKVVDKNIVTLINQIKTQEKNSIEMFSFKEINLKEKKFILDEDKEKEILNSLLKIENNLEYLKQDFSLIMVSKKIKTNTTYLSYVVNKNFEKTFSEYYNELKINYVIKELINNSNFRKYSTQAIAESAGFKNAISFSKSFSKKTGVTPIKFIDKINETI